jgi:hypothetical protein
MSAPPRAPHPIETTPYLAHLADALRVGTACRAPWQGWQAPFGYAGERVPPHEEPVRGDAIRGCPACLGARAGVPPADLLARAPRGLTR